MKKFLILHFGFEMPTPEDMAGWNSWFASIADRQVERGHLPGGKEISEDGLTDLPFGKDSLTGYTMIEAADLDEATAIAKECPYVLSTRVYEVKSQRWGNIAIQERVKSEQMYLWSEGEGRRKAMLELKDSKSQPRIRLIVDESDQARIEFLNAAGEVIRVWAGEP